MRMAIRPLAVTALTATLAVLAGAVLPEAAPQQAPRVGAIEAAPVTRQGWWIRVNPANQADNVSWRFGAARNRLSNPVRWFRGENQTEFDLPGDHRGLPVLHVAAIGFAYKAPVSFCVFFQDHGAALIEFAGEHNDQIEQAQQAPACVP